MSRPADQRNVRRALENLFAFLLRHAPQHAEFLPLFLEFLVIVQAIEDFLLGFVPDGARIVENQPSLFDRRNLKIAFRTQSADDFLRVVRIHLAAERLKVKSLLWGFVHESLV